MRIRFIYFAGVREATGKTQEDAELKSGATVADAVEWLGEQHPTVKRILPTVRVAKNREFCKLAEPLDDGDELVLIPPISGGTGDRVGLTSEPIDREAATQLIDTSGAGAIITFAGVVRPTSKGGRDVTDLFYEAYDEMARAKLQQCLDEAGALWEVLDSAVIHRLGALSLGEVAVSIAVSTAHRKEGFAACGYIIDRIKEIVPIWKKETGPDGSEWVSEGA